MVWYIAIGLMVLIGIATFVVWVPANKMPGRKWPEFAFCTLFLFACLSKLYWRYHKRLRLWLMLLVCLEAHLAISVPILLRIERPPTLYYQAIMPIEGVLIMLVLWRSVRVSPDANVQL
jgi:hypothetical protein